MILSKIIYSFLSFDLYSRIRYKRSIIYLNSRSFIHELNLIELRNIYIYIYSASRVTLIN